MALGLEDLETGIAAAKAKAESQDATRVRRHGVKRGDLPDHLPRVEIVIEPRTRSAPAAVEHCMSSVRTNPSALTLSLPSIVSS